MYRSRLLAILQERRAACLVEEMISELLENEQIALLRL